MDMCRSVIIMLPLKSGCDDLGDDVEAGHSPWELAAQLPIKWPFSANGQTGSMSEAGESRHVARQGVGGF